MNNIFRKDSNCLIRDYDSEKLFIEPWGENSLRIRVTHMSKLDDNNWALLEANKVLPIISIDEKQGEIQNGNIKAIVDLEGRISFYNTKGDLLLREYTRYWGNKHNPSSLKIGAREFIPILGGDYKLTMRFESESNEKIFGMGQYQQPFLNMKNCSLELAHRNSQSSVPFYISNLGYGFLWNNPAIGKVNFSKNITEWTANCTKQLDFWITAEETPAKIEESYARATGTVPMMPDYGMGFWQSKLRYQTQEELLDVAREYKKRDIPLSVIVIDFFHWPKEGDWCFDENYWPDPVAMVKELKSMGIETMVSIWPTVDMTSDNYEEMLAKGYLTRTDRGIRPNMQFVGDTVFYDATNPKAREFLWNTVKKNYYDKGIKTFWLDEAEPEYTTYDFDNYRYHMGTNIQVGNIYPSMYSKTFFDGMRKEGEKNILNLVRCAWAGSQRYGALAWSGDVHSSFESFRNQIRAGLNMSIAGITWWTSDIGGFFGGDVNDSTFKECLIRWFQYGVFCPVFRLHGDREPHTKALGNKGGGAFHSGAPNEIWSYGEEAYNIFKKYIDLRENLRPYIKILMKESHIKGTPPMRPLFYDFPNDAKSWEVDDQYMFGPDILVSPVMYEGIKSRKVYLPIGSKWICTQTKKVFEGGVTIVVNAPIDIIPLFLRANSNLDIKI